MQVASRVAVELKRESRKGKKKKKIAMFLTCSYNANIYLPPTQKISLGRLSSLIAACSRRGEEEEDE